MYKDGLTPTDYFSNLSITSFTLFQIMCVDNWSEIARDIMETYTWSKYLFILYIFNVSLFLLHIFIAIFCQSLNKTKIEDLSRENIKVRTGMQTRTYQDMEFNMDNANNNMIKLIELQKKTTDNIYDIAHQIECQKDGSNTLFCCSVTADGDDDDDNILYFNKYYYNNNNNLPFKSSLLSR